MLRPEYPIETARLTLRPFRRDDLDDVYAYHARPEVVRYLYWETPDRAEVFKGEWGDELVDAMLDQEWRAGGDERVSCLLLGISGE